MYRILVSGLGALIGYGIVNSLRASRYPVEVIGIDMYPDAYGQHLCDEFLVCPPNSSPEYRVFLANLFAERNIDLVIPGIESDVYFYWNNRDIASTYETQIVLNSPALLELSSDKWSMHQFLIRHQFPVIPSEHPHDFEDLAEKLGSPFILKPRHGSASKGIVQIHCAEDFHYWIKYGGHNYFAQKIVGTDESEYTVGVFGFGDGTSTNPISFQRRLGREGSTVKASTVDIAQLDAMSGRLTKALRPLGPTNYQFREHKGEFLLLEANPRVSSSSSIRTCLGYNEIEMCIEFFLEHTKPKDIDYSRGRVSRYIADHVYFNKASA